jgi:type IV pilus biogenesis protein PilP
LAEAQSEAALLKAQLEIAKLKAEIAKAKSGKLDSGPAQAVSGYPVPGSGPFPMVAPHAGTESTSLPRILGISGTGSRLTATLALPDGGTISVQAGQSLPPYGRVTRITDRGVFIAHDRKVEPLPFVSAPSGNAEGGSLPAPTGFPTPGAGFANPLASAPVYGPPSIPSGSLPPKSSMPTE